MEYPVNYDRTAFAKLLTFKTPQELRDVIAANWRLVHDAEDSIASLRARIAQAEQELRHQETPPL